MEQGVDVYAVSVDSPGASKRLKQKLDVQITFLSDSDGSLLDAVGIRHVGAHEGRDIAYPTSVLVDRSGAVRWIFSSETPNVRAHPEDVLTAISALAG